MNTLLIWLGMAVGALALDIQGVNFIGMPYTRISVGDVRSKLALESLKTTGANWITVPITVFQDFKNSSLSYLGVHPFIMDSGTYETSHEKDILAIVQHAHQLGLKVMLQFHCLVNMPNWPDSREIGEYWAPFNAIKWFERYYEHIAFYTKALESAGIDMISLGHNFHALGYYEQQWRLLAEKVRNITKAPLIYSAAYGDEERQTGFWDSLDYIGVFPKFKSATQELLQSEIKDFIRTLKYMNKMWKKPVIITRVAVCTTSQDKLSQDLVFRTVYQAATELDFVKGIIFGDWVADILYGSANDVTYSVQKKQGEKTIRELFGGTYRQIDAPEGKVEYRLNCDCYLK